MPSRKKNLLKAIFVAHGGCDCGRPKLSDVHEPIPKPRRSSTDIPQNTNLCDISSSSSCDKQNVNGTSEDNTSTTTLSFNIETSSQNSESETDHPKPSSSKLLSQCPKIVDSVAVVKDSNEPYQDFRNSMLQMIMEKEIFSEDDLKELLCCFLELNSPCHHDTIVRAFMEICNEVFSDRLHLQERCGYVHGGRP